MSIEEAIRDHLIAAGIASGRVWQLILPQHPALPAVRVQLIDQPRRAHLRGYGRVYRSRVQIDAFASATTGSDPYEGVSTVADAIEATLGPEPFDIGSPAVSVLMVRRDDRRPFYQPAEINAVRMMQDFIVWHRAAA